MIKLCAVCDLPFDALGNAKRCRGCIKGTTLICKQCGKGFERIGTKKSIVQKNVDIRQNIKIKEQTVNRREYMKEYRKMYILSDKYKSYRKSDKYKAQDKARKTTNEYKEKQKKYAKSYMDKYMVSYRKTENYKKSQKTYKKTEKGRSVYNSGKRRRYHERKRDFSVLVLTEIGQLVSEIERLEVNQNDTTKQE